MKYLNDVYLNILSRIGCACPLAMVAPLVISAITGKKIEMN